MRTIAQEIERQRHRLDHVVEGHVRKSHNYAVKDLELSKTHPDYKGKPLKRWLKESIRSRISQFEWQLCPCDIENLTQQDKEVIEDINSQISGRTSYGGRGELAQKGYATALYWSNGIAHWIIGRRYKKGEEVTLDANEVLVQGVKPKDLDRFLCCLDELPLYHFSHEGRKTMTPEMSKTAHEEWAKRMQEKRDYDLEMALWK